MIPAALLFDLDGTLLDSDPLHVSVFSDMLRAEGHIVDKAFYLANVHGRLNTDVFSELMPRADAKTMDIAKEAEFRRRLILDPLPPTAGLVDLLAKAAVEGIPCAVVTNACRLNADAMLKTLGLSNRFAAVITSDDCAQGKPDPAPYLAGAAALGVPAHICVAFEDSPTGLRSAHDAGCTVVGMTSSLNPANLRAHGAHLTINDFTDPALADLLDAETGALS